ncbi:hypothetical protein GGD81_002247 [Rhodobium orientis]|uniref:Tat pathway signal sequence domain protein n=1 Tax=Rhodobium orientis TaxID=34017 RepID=A0A327JIK0_9HYPH|nr:hypothetical protein [Rhodobium orientis]MBB4303204.1 hypothetical protein [Rhodobium orientis]MBK5951695.1 hypothetical protein [Rhodobium orientis]RAI25831.1 hypothetical protein CH339_16475 [Rhodobium orientis]
MIPRTVLSLLVLLAVSMVTPAGAAESLPMELNKAATVAGKCRVTMVVRNGLARPLSALSVDVVVFDKEGGVAGYSALNFGALPAGKMRVRQYDIAEMPCAEISRLLINDIRKCGEGGEAQCLGLLEPSSRLDIDFAL